MAAAAATRGASAVTGGPSTVTIVAGADAFGQALKDSVVESLRTKPGVTVLDLGTDSYYAIAERVARAVTAKKQAEGSGVTVDKQGEGEAVTVDKQGEGEAVAEDGSGAGEVRGLLVCGTGGGVAMVANKLPGVSSVCCDTPGAARNARSINNCNVLALGALHTSSEEAQGILDAFLTTGFKDPCPASKGEAWSKEIDSFLDSSLGAIAAIGAGSPGQAAGAPQGKGEGVGEGRGQAEGVPDGTDGPQRECAICDLAAGRVLADVAEMPGGAWRVIRESPTTAVVSFRAGSIEPAHHHTFSHDIIVLSGHKSVQNLSSSQTFELRTGDFLSTPAGDVHRVYYHSDTQFFIKWDGPCDILLDENLEMARAKLQETILKP